MRKVDQKGFSLIEILIAITILGIVVTPMLNSFVSSYRMSARSRQVMEATTLAQNEMEIFEKESVETLTTNAGYVYKDPENKTGYQVVKDDDDGQIHFKREGVMNGSTSGPKYDIYVELDPSRDDATDRYYAKNKAPLLAMNSVGMIDTATFVQTIRTVGNPLDADSNAYTWFYNHQRPDSNWTKDMMELKVKRDIILKLEKYTQDSKIYTRVSVKYDYSLEDDEVMKPEHFHYIATEKVIFDNALQKDEEGNSIPLEEVYLFYGPTYKWDSLAQMDKIIVENKDGIEADIYILRQEILIPTATDTSQVKVVPNDYKPRIVIHDKVTDGKTAGVYHTNLNIDNSQSGIGGKVELSLDDGASGTYDRDQILAATGLSPMTAEVVEDRIYEMTVKVYESGADVSTASPLVTMTGTKLD